MNQASVAANLTRRIYTSQQATVHNSCAVQRYNNEHTYNKYQRISISTIVQHNHLIITDRHTAHLETLSCMLQQ